MNNMMVLKERGVSLTNASIQTLRKNRLIGVYIDFLKINTTQIFHQEYQQPF